MDRLNEYCWHGTVNKFLSLDCDEWLRRMTQRYHRVTQHKLTSQQERAWKNSFAVLHSALLELGSEYRKLHMVFEYCLPKYPPNANGELSAEYVIRADCIIVSRETVVVLEFKDRSEAITPHGFTVRRYRNRLQKYHDQSKGKRKWAILVPTLSADIREILIQRITACSPNRLAEELKAQFGEKPTAVASFREWLASSYSLHG